MFWLALIVAHETGHRIGAGRLLRWSDIDFARGEVRWRAENDKRKFDHVTPLMQSAVAALQEAQPERPAIADVWVFPSPSDAAQSVSRHLLRNW